MERITASDFLLEFCSLLCERVRSILGPEIFI